MFWKHEEKNGLTVVYGFTSVKQNFDAVWTLHDEGDQIRANGFLSTIKLDRVDYKVLFEYAKKIISKPLVFEVTLPAARLYKSLFAELNYTIVEEKPGKTFDGYDSLLVKVTI